MKLDELRREIDWRIQNTLSISTPVIKRPVNTTARLERLLDPRQKDRYLQLTVRYSLTRWLTQCSAKEFMFNLYLLDLLDRYFPVIKLNGRGLDIGASSWSYLPALVSATGLEWDGVELDANRRYWTLATRRAHAEFVCRHYPGCRYLAGSLLDITGEYCCITWFLPFVTTRALQYWRLPQRFFQPRTLLAHAWSKLRPRGVMLVVNQGEYEAEEQGRLFDGQSIVAEYIGELPSVFYRFSQPRFAWIAHKPFPVGQNK